MKATQRSQMLLYAPEALTRLRAGFEKLATPLASTLGPSRRLVINSVTASEIELLADTSTIATRFIELKKRGENVGAMMLRTMVMQLHERYGDGAATATVLARDMLRGADRLLAAGVNPAIMKRGIERGTAVARQALAEQAVPIEGPEMFTRLVSSMIGEVELGKILGEMLDMMGDNPAYVIHENVGLRTEREYVAGGNWVAIPGDRLLIPEGRAGLELHRPLIMLVDDELTTLEQVQPALELAIAHPEKPPLLIVAREFKDAAKEAVILNHVRGTLNVGVALLRSGTLLITEDLEDIAILTGGAVLASERGEPAQRVRNTHFGRARKATITQETLTIIEGRGDSQSIRKRIADIRARMNSARELDSNWDWLRTRIGRLSGGVAVLKIGAYTEQEYEMKKEQVTKAMRALNDTTQGIVAGGGTAYLNCIPALEAEAEACADNDEAAGIRLVASALAAPFVQIITNYGGIYPPLALAEVRRMGRDHGFDGLRGDYTDMFERGIIDSTRIVQAALDAATSLATMAITTAMIVSL